MHQWHAFIDEIRSIYHATDFTHDVPCNDETEPYTVGSELGLTARFVRNLCDPVAKALTPLPHMDKLIFADIQSIAPIDNVIPDVRLGLVAESANVSNVIMVGELETPWTTFLQPVTVENPSYAPLIESLMGKFLVSTSPLKSFLEGFILIIIKVEWSNE